MTFEAAQLLSACLDTLAPALGLLEPHTLPTPTDNASCGIGTQHDGLWTQALEMRGPVDQSWTHTVQTTTSFTLQEDDKGKSSSTHPGKVRSIDRGNWERRGQHTSGSAESYPASHTHLDDRSRSHSTGPHLTTAEPHLTSPALTLPYPTSPRLTSPRLAV